jgi:hypothetical protein
MTPGPPGPAGAPAPGPRFEFGANWRSFSRQSLDPRALEAARLSLTALLGQGRIRGARFVDVGCGSRAVLPGRRRAGRRRGPGLRPRPRAVRTSQDNLRACCPNTPGACASCAAPSSTRPSPPP